MKNVFVNGGDQIVTRQYMTRLVLVVVSKATHSSIADYCGQEVRMVPT